MTDHVLSCLTWATYATTSHAQELFAGGPYRPRWSDFHDPDLEPDEQLGARFKRALIQIEELLYVINGAVPDYTGDHAWYDRAHPRCLWGPEQWKGPTRLDYHPNNWEYHEYAAFGTDRVLASYPEVPLRSRSGDPALQVALARHSSACPAGSVWRTAVTRTGAPSPDDADGADAHDPRSTRWDTALAFPDVQPFRRAEKVTIWYRPPAGIILTGLNGTGVALYYEWDGTGGYVNMTFDEETELWRYTLVGPQAQGVTCSWFVRVRYRETEAGPLLTVYDPVGEDGGAPTVQGFPPVEEHLRGEFDCYAFRYFTHHNYYRNGLPEFLWWYDGALREQSGNQDLYWPDGYHRKNTDYYTFAGDEEVQVGLINMARFVLDWIGRRSHHSPYTRGDMGACCFFMPITWRWSGGNTYPHYVGGGKGAADGIRPLHDNPTETAFTPAPSQAARMSWRGIPVIYKDPGYHGNCTYGWGTESHLSGPEQLVAEANPPEEYPEGLYQWMLGPNPASPYGLRKGDVVDRVHILEIEAAVQYLIKYGIVQHVGYCSRKMTPAEFMGYDCGHHYTRTYSTLHGEHIDESWVEAQKCLDGEGNPWPAPTWEECTDPCYKTQCTLHHERGRSCTSSLWPEYYYAESQGRALNCNYGGLINCGRARDQVTCGWNDGAYVPNYGSGFVSAEVGGWSRYVCGPRACQEGPDDVHGNTWHKERWTHTTTTDPANRSYPTSMGNCFGAVESCSEFVGDEWDPPVDFETVSPQVWTSPASIWDDGRGADCPLGGCSGALVDDYPDLPGFGHYSWNDEQPLCSYSTGEIYGGGLPPRKVHLWGCGCVMPGTICTQYRMWVWLDLNLDGTGLAYGGDGTGIPKLRPYTMPQPAGYIEAPSQCPCETATGVVPCM